ncbi:MAG: thioredoxin domain-containing protein [Deltaproteobacteria bacterium]
MTTNTENNKKPNRLINQKSPYLLQHAYNPVDWHPWSEEAFEKATSRDLPIFLSIGYSTCHWCHVMERESFEDEDVANILNNHFISIKVDREERPDIDNIYMSICQALTGSGGWPLTIIMTPDKKPFFTGTYFPKHSKMGLMGLIDLLSNITDAWSHSKHLLYESGNNIINSINSTNKVKSTSPLSENDLENAFSALSMSFDSIYGGFGFAPKFPMPHNLMFLLRYWKKYNNEKALEMVEKTLVSMYYGGIFDHIGFGFSRYSTDRQWLVPHFEKMLYDNALLSIAYSEAFQATGKSLYSDVAEMLFDYILKNMTSPEGGFYSAEDADSEGEEGKFYLWHKDEIISVLGSSDADYFCSFYDITLNGNFEGKNIPNLIRNSRNISVEEKKHLDFCRKKLFDYREERIHPYKDDKILTSWNGLMIAALSFGARVLDNDDYLYSAKKAADFIIDNLKDRNGRLLARYRDGESAHRGYIDDYAFFIWGLIELYEASHESRYLKHALDFNQQLLDSFWDKEKGGLFFYSEDSEQLLLRPKDSYDGSIPSGNSVSTLNLLRIARLTGKSELEELAQKQYEAFADMIKAYPASHTFFLMSYLFLLSDTKEIILIGDMQKAETKKMLQKINSAFLPEIVFHVIEENSDAQSLNELVPFLENHKSEDDLVSAFICRNQSCQSPITNFNDFEKVINSHILLSL